MMFTALGPDLPMFRALTPKWAFAPESGEGAARQGGRFNRVGVPARYLAASLDAAAAEYQAESALLPPFTLATYLVSAPRVVDFTGGYEPTVGVRYGPRLTATGKASLSRRKSSLRVG